MQKIFVIILMSFALCTAEELLLNDFDSNYTNLTALPKSPPVIISPIQAAPAANSQKALRLTTVAEQNYPILQYPLKNKNKYFDASKYNTLSFYLKSDTSTQLEIAFADQNNMTPFVAAADYLPKKNTTKNWQKVQIPLNYPALDKQKLDCIYFKIVTDKNNSKDILYLDTLAFDNVTQKPPAAAQRLKIYDFENKLKSSFQAQPETAINKPGSLQLFSSAAGHYGAEGTSLGVSWNSLGCDSGLVFLPIVRRAFDFDASGFTQISFQLKNPQNLPLTVQLIQENEKTAANNYQQTYSTEYNLQSPDAAWHYIKLPLNPEQKNKFSGIKFYVPANSSGCFYLDEVYLE